MPRRDGKKAKGRRRHRRPCLPFLNPRGTVHFVAHAFNWAVRSTCRMCGECRPDNFGWASNMNVAGKGNGVDPHAGCGRFYESRLIGAFRANLGFWIFPQKIIAKCGGSGVFQTLASAAASVPCFCPPAKRLPCPSLPQQNPKPHRGVWPIPENQA